MAAYWALLWALALLLIGGVLFVAFPGLALVAALAVIAALVWIAFLGVASLRSDHGAEEAHEIVEEQRRRGHS